MDRVSSADFWTIFVAGAVTALVAFGAVRVGMA